MSAARGPHQHACLAACRRQPLPCSVQQFKLHAGACADPADLRGPRVTLSTLRRYAFYWNFYQDGTIDYQIKLTGELSTNALSPHELAMGKGTYGTVVAPGVNAQNHQHMFCARLDLALDCEQGGRPLVVTEARPCLARCACSAR